MHVFKVALSRGLSGLFLEEILPAKGFVWDFFGKRFDARLKYFEKLHNLMNLVVKWDLGSGGCRKLLWVIFWRGKMPWRSATRFFLTSSDSRCNP
jgi:hypothetical protein